MRRARGAVLWTAIGCAGVAGIGVAAQNPAPKPPAPKTPPAAAPPPPPTSHPAAPSSAQSSAALDQNAVVKRYCVTCHNDTRKTGGLSLASFDVTKAAQNAELSERVVRKLQAGFMPPPGASRPDAAAHAALISA